MKGWTKNTAKKQKGPKEESIQIQVSNYIRTAYPNAIFTAESSGLRLPMGLAMKAKKQRSERALPDLILLEPRGKYHGLCVELKKVSPFKRDGTLKRQMQKRPNGERFDHLAEQKAVLERLMEKGYWAQFATGFDEARRLIDAYMRG
jgi:hypothetical protein